jgi:hypothetical protein
MLACCEQSVLFVAPGPTGPSSEHGQTLFLDERSLAWEDVTPPGRPRPPGRGDPFPPGNPHLVPTVVYDLRDKSAKTAIPFD